MDVVRNPIVHINVYDCHCWARNATVHAQSNPSEVCGGRVYISVTECKIGVKRGYETRVKFEHVQLPEVVDGSGPPT